MKIRDFYFFGLFLIFMSLLFSSGQVENPDTHLRLTQSRLLIEEGKFGLPADTGEDFHGNVAINSKGERHMAYNPGQSILFYPIYAFSKVFCPNNPYYTSTFIISFINYLIHAFCGFFLFQILLCIGKDRKKSLLVSLIFLFTSYSFSFAQSTYEHHFEMLFILISLYIILQKRKYSFLIAGLVLSLGLVYRSTTILIVPGILFLISDRKQILYLILGIAPGLMILLLYNYYRFGNPLETGYRLAWINAHGEDFKFWSVSYLPKALFGYLFSPGKGLIFYSTTIFIGIFGLKDFFQKDKKLTYLVLCTTLLFICLYSLNFAWHGSIWAFGPRYILPILPLLYLFLVDVKFSRWIWAIFVFGFLSQVLFVTVNYKRDVLEQHVQFNGIDENQYISTIGNIPQLTQSKQFAEILPKNLNIELQSYQLPTPWKKEVRTGSSEQVLTNSIEKNSVNFWWVRVFHWNKPPWVKVGSVFLVIISLGGMILLTNMKFRSIEV